MNRLLVVDFVMKILLVASIIIFIVTVILVISGNKKKNDCNVCIGTIIGFQEKDAVMNMDSYRSKTISPIISYSVDGKDYEFIGNFYSTNMKVGQEIKVLYRKDDFSKATISTGVAFAPMITGFIGLFLFLPAVIYFIIKFKGII